MSSKENVHMERLFSRKRLCVLLGVFFFSVFAILTLSVPLNSPKKQYLQGYQHLDPLSPTLNHGDSAFLISSTVFGFLVSPLLSRFYGATMGNSTSSMYYITILSAAAVTMLWIAIGFSLSYGDATSSINLFGNPSTYYMFRGVGAAPNSSLADSIPLIIFAIYELTFAVLASTILSCTLHDKVNALGWIFFVSVWHILVYCPVAHLIWGSSTGWLAQNNVQDFAGGLVVHMTSGFSALAIRLYLEMPKHGVHPQMIQPNASAMKSERTDFSIVSSSATVWLAWIILTSGKHHSASFIATQSLANTFISTCASIFTWGILDLLMHGKNTVITFTNALIVSLVTMSSLSGHCTVGGSICATTICAQATYFFAYKITEELKEPSDSLSSLTLHCFTGTFGFLLTSIFSFKFEDHNGSAGMIYGNFWTMAYHLVVIAVFIPIVMLLSLILFYICDIILPSHTKLTPVVERNSRFPQNQPNTPYIEFAGLYEQHEIEQSNQNERTVTHLSSTEVTNNIRENTLDSINLLTTSNFVHDNIHERHYEKFTTALPQSRLSKKFTEAQPVEEYPFTPLVDTNLQVPGGTARNSQNTEISRASASSNNSQTHLNSKEFMPLRSKAIFETHRRRIPGSVLTSDRSSSGSSESRRSLEFQGVKLVIDRIPENSSHSQSVSSDNSSENSKVIVIHKKNNQNFREYAI